MNIRYRQAFTLVELIIVIAMIGVLTGMGAKLWLTLEHNAKAVNQNLSFYTQSESIVQRLVEDIRKAETLAPPEDALLKLSQIGSDGRRIEISYTLQKNELIRSIWFQGTEEVSQKIASIPPGRLTIAPQPQGWIRIQLERTGQERPLQVQARRLISYARPLGVR